jgi:ABC-2 type transport system permease protein
MQAVAKLLPPSYVFEGVRAAVAGQTVDTCGLAIGLALALVQIVLAYLVFARVHAYAVRSGLLARYSAEGVA